MESTDDFLKQLEPLLAQLNMQNLSKVQNNQAQTNGSNTNNLGGRQVDTVPTGTPDDAIGQIIQHAEAQDQIEAIIRAADNKPAVTKPTPKTTGSQLNVGPAAVAPKESQTTVIAATPQTNKNTQTKYRPFTETVTPDVIAKYTKLYGVPDSNVTKAILEAAKATGTDESILFKFAKAESNFNPKAKAKTSSATGLFQFLDGTWNHVIDSLGGGEKFKLSGNKKDAYENAVAGAIYLNEIKKGLSTARKSGVFTPGELYLGHFAGPGTAAKAIKLIDSGKGNFKASEAFTPAQIKANKTIFYDKDGKMRSVAQVAQILAQKVA